MADTLGFTLTLQEIDCILLEIGDGNYEDEEKWLRLILDTIARLPCVGGVTGPSPGGPSGSDDTRHVERSANPADQVFR